MGRREYETWRRWFDRALARLVLHSEGARDRLRERQGARRASGGRAPDEGSLAAGPERSLDGERAGDDASAGTPPATPSPLLSPPAPFSHRPREGYVLHSLPRADERLAFALSVARGLDARPRRLESRWLYDAEGSRLFERITRTPEYYPTRTEDAILAAHAREIAAAIRAQSGAARAGAPPTVVELGSGSSTKTRRLLSALAEEGPARYLPIDVSAAALEEACPALVRAFPSLHVEALAAPFDRALPIVAALSPLCLLFLGSSLGNLDAGGARALLDDLARTLSPGDLFLLGLDLVKEPARLEAAYDDAAGHTAAFTRNLFARMNRELGTAIDLDAVEHVAFWDDAEERIEISARFRREVRVDLPLLGRSFRVARGETIRTELSCKYRVAPFVAECARAGFELVSRFEDAEHLFAVLLLRLAPRGADGGRAPSSGGLDAASMESLLRRVRLRTHEIVAPLSDADLARQHHALMGPIAWDLGHIASYEALWLDDKLAADRAGEPEPTLATDATTVSEGLPPLFDPLVHPRDVRGRLALPSREELLARLDATRARALGRLRTLAARDEGKAAAAAADVVVDVVDIADPGLVEHAFVYHLVAQHEAQHQETMLAAINLREDLVYAPPFVRPEVASHAPARPRSAVLVPAGPFRMGADRGRERPFLYDNECPSHEVDLPAFRIDAAPVTNGELAAFIADGGYDRRELWSDEGFRVRTEMALRAPLGWERRGSAWLSRSFGRLRPIDPDRPVVHVSFFEAEAYARWRGARLPTEAEWEKAAAWDAEHGRARLHPWGDDPPDEPSRGFAVERANLGAARLEPAPVFTLPAGESFYGCHQMLGDVWEWTASAFRPYPGFVAFPYREYSEIWFGDRYRVLRGGSFATLPVAARCTFRNWDLPERRQIFAGFRCAEDA